MSKKHDKSEKLLDSIYANKGLLLRYFAVALITAVLRYIIEIILNPIFSTASEAISFFVWSLMFFPTVKLIAFKNRAGDIFRLLLQIMLYIMCIAILWVSRQVFVGILYMLTSNIAIGVSVGGAINEILCLALMVKIVFRKKENNII